MQEGLEDMAEDKPRVFTRTRDGKTNKQIAYTPADVVKFRFDGWTEITGAEATKTLTTAERDQKAAEKAAADAEKAAAADAAKK